MERTQVRQKLQDALAIAPAPADLHRPRMWIDRSFAAKGAGTIVTGTLTLGSLRVDDEVIIEPASRLARIRSIQSGHQRAEVATPGARVALNLVGVDHHEVRRGDALVCRDAWHSTNVVDVRFQSSDTQDLPARATVSVHVGSGERTARWRRHDTAGLHGRLRFTEPLPLQPGDRLVLRSTARRAVMGGAVVTDVDPPRRWKPLDVDAATLTTAESVISRTPWLTLQQIVSRAGLDPTTASQDLETLQQTGALHHIDDAYLSDFALQSFESMIHDAVTQHHQRFPDERGANIAELSNALGLETRRLRLIATTLKDLTIDHDTIRAKDHVGKASETPEGQRFIRSLEAAPFSPPSPAELEVEIRIVKLLVREGIIEQHQDIYFTTAAIAEARRIIATEVIRSETMTIANIRDLLGTSRKYVLPIVAALDAAGITRRRGDDRIAGPRAALVARE